MLLKLGPVELLSKHISRIVMSGNVFEGNFSFQDTVPDEMVFALNVLGFCMENRVF